MDIQYEYQRLVESVKKMMQAQEEARKSKNVQAKWVVANKLEKEVKELINPKPATNKMKQATFEWLAR